MKALSGPQYEREQEKTRRNSALTGGREKTRSKASKIEESLVPLGKKEGRKERLSRFPKA